MDFDLLILIATVPLLLLFVWDLFVFFSFLAKWIKKGDKSDSESKQQKSEMVPTKKGIGAKVFGFIWALRLPLLHVIVLSFSAWVAFTAYSPAPRIESSYPEWEGRWDSYTKPITLVFNVPVQTDALKPFLSNSELTGTWVYEPWFGMKDMTRIAKFYPKTTQPPDRRLVVYMTGVKRIGVEEYHEHPANMYTHLAPEINSTTPQLGQVDVATNTDIVFTLNRLNEGLTEWRFEITPEIEVDFTLVSDNTLVLNPKEDLAQTETYNIKVFRSSVIRDLQSQEILDQESEELVHEIEFSTVRAPLVKKFTPSGTGVKVDTDIRLEFETDMDQASVMSLMSITPTIDADTTWESSSVLVINPKTDLPKDTKYTINFPPGVKSTTGGVSETAISYSFTTIGAVRVAKFSPRDKEVRVLRSSSIKVTFDQEVDKASAQSKFSISPSIPGKFSWSGNTMTYNPSRNLSFNTNYTVRIASGVKTINGLDSKQAFSAKFKTVPNVTIIQGFSSATWDRQDYNFSCGVAALRMALAWKGFSVSEYHLIYNQLGINTSTMTGCLSAAGCRWGDPNASFLGQPNGSGTYGNGQSAYGVHWQPVKRVLEQNYGVTTELKRGWNVVGLAQTINQGRPVQIWWWNGVSNCYGSSVGGGARIDWTGPSGQNIEAICGMHSVLVVGFTGDPTNPTGFIVEDPWWGYQTYDISRFYSQWPRLNNTGLIIH